MEEDIFGARAERKRINNKTRGGQGCCYILNTININEGNRGYLYNRGIVIYVVFFFVLDNFVWMAVVIRYGPCFAWGDFKHRPERLRVINVLLDEIGVKHRLEKAEQMNLVQIIAATGDDAHPSLNEIPPKKEDVDINEKGKEKVVESDHEDDAKERKIIFACSLANIPYLSRNDTTDRMIEAVKQHFKIN
jgi:hypothetical protein